MTTETTTTPQPPEDQAPQLRVGLELVATPAGLNRLLGDLGVSYPRSERSPGYRLLTLSVITPEGEDHAA